MNNNIKNLIILLLSIGLFSCSPRLSTFSENIMTEAALTDEELSKVQFYLGSDIVLVRDSDESVSKRINGKIEVRDSRSKEQVVISRGTPGAFFFRTHEDNIAIGFDEKCDECYLVFGPNPKARGEYRLLAKSWHTNHGVVTYGDKEFNTPIASSRIRLMIDYRVESRINQQTSNPAGRKVR